MYHDGFNQSLRNRNGFLVWHRYYFDILCEHVHHCEDVDITGSILWMRPRDVDAQPFPRLAARNWLQRALIWRSFSPVLAALRTPAAVFLDVPGPTNPVGSSADLMLRPLYSKVTTGDTGVRGFDKVL